MGLRDLQHRHVAQGVYDDVAVRQHHALRRSGRPCAGMTRAQSPAPDTRNLAGGKLGTVATRRGRLSMRGCTNGARFFGFGLVSFPARSLGSLTTATILVWSTRLYCVRWTMDALRTTIDALRTILGTQAATDGPGRTTYRPCRTGRTYRHRRAWRRARPPPPSTCARTTGSRPASLRRPRR